MDEYKIRVWYLVFKEWKWSYFYAKYLNWHLSSFFYKSHFSLSLATAADVVGWSRDGISWQWNVTGVKTVHFTSGSGRWRSAELRPFRRRRTRCHWASAWIWNSDAHGVDSHSRQIVSKLRLNMFSISWLVHRMSKTAAPWAVCRDYWCWSLCEWLMTGGCQGCGPEAAPQYLQVKFSNDQIHCSVSVSSRDTAPCLC